MGSWRASRAITGEQRMGSVRPGKVLGRVPARDRRITDQNDAIWTGNAGYEFRRARRREIWRGCPVLQHGDGTAGHHRTALAVKPGGGPVVTTSIVMIAEFRRRRVGIMNGMVGYAADGQQ